MLFNCRKIVKIVRSDLGNPLLRNSFYLMLSTISGAGSGFFFWYFAAQFYSEESIGIASAIISSIGLISMFSRCGFDIGIIRYLSNENNKNGMINSCFTIIFIISTALSCFFLIIIPYISGDLLFIRKNAIFSVLFIIFTISSSLLLVQSNIFAALRNAKYSLIQNLITMLRILALPFLIIWGINGIYISYGLGLFIALIIGNYFIYKVFSLYKFKIMIDKKIIRNIFHFSVGNYIATIFEGIPNFVLPLLVITILGPEQNAYFFIAWSISSILMMIPKATSLSLLAEGSNTIDDFNRNSKKALKFIFSLLLPFIFIIYYFGDYILSLFGESYSMYSFNILCIFSVASIPYSINIYYVTIKRVQKKTIEVLLVHSFIGFFTIISGSFLMLWFDLIGLSIAWLTANLIVSTIITLNVYVESRSKL